VPQCPIAGDANGTQTQLHAMNLKLKTYFFVTSLMYTPPNVVDCFSFFIVIEFLSSELFCETGYRLVIETDTSRYGDRYSWQ